MGKYLSGTDQYTKQAPGRAIVPVARTPPGAYPLEGSLLTTHIEPAEHAPLALGSIEISLLPSPFGLPVAGSSCGKLRA